MRAAIVARLSVLSTCGLKLTMSFSTLPVCQCPRCQGPAEYADRRLDQLKNLLLSHLDEAPRQWGRTAWGFAVVARFRSLSASTSRPYIVAARTWPVSSRKFPSGVFGGRVVGSENADGVVDSSAAGDERPNEGGDYELRAGVDVVGSRSPRIPSWLLTWRAKDWSRIHGLVGGDVLAIRRSQEYAERAPRITMLLGSREDRWASHSPTNRGR